jgi:dTMP kinase
MNARLIVLEGLDGSGKATQAGRLIEHLAQTGRPVRKISFPDYANKSSTLVKMYLNGEIGSIDEVNAYAAASFYAMDRYISYHTGWKADYRAGGVIVADRYTTSNLSHQMAKLAPGQWEGYIEWLTDYEYRLLGLPPPDLVIYLDMHPEASMRLIEGRYQGDEQKKDLHEQNFCYLQACRRAALFAAERLGWTVIGCSDAQHRPLAVDEIAEAVARAAGKLNNPEDIC